MQRQAFVTAQQQKAHHTCEQTQTLFCAKTGCSDIPRFLSYWKTCHTPSSGCARRGRWKFFPLRRLLPFRPSGQSHWPYPFQCRLASITPTPHLFFVIFTLWWLARGQCIWFFPCCYTNICSNCHSPSSTLIFIFFYLFAFLSPFGQHRFAHSLSLAQAWGSKDLHASNFFWPTSSFKRGGGIRGKWQCCH